MHKAAKAFVERWTFRRGSEKGEDQQFWNDLLGGVLGLDDVAAHVQYQVPVPMRGTTKFLDAWIPETHVLVEHKSRGVSLDAPQSGHDGLTPYEQAVEYDNARPFDEKARWIVTCNFDAFRIYDRARPLAPPLSLRLADLPKEAYRLAFLVNPKEKAVDRELEISVQAGRIVGELYDALLKQYAAADSDALAALNRLCVRLVFCLYAEDAEVFPKDCLRRLVEATPANFLRTRLADLFRVLDTPLADRDPYLEPELAIFPYTNGGLFRGKDDIPPLTEEIRQLLLGASRFDWREITPTIFGALFESTLNPATRRAGGMVYTSVENIHKAIGPLFLDAISRRVAALKARPLDAATRRACLALQDELASLTFLDPACGSGNFLTETYLCLRRLENRLIAHLQRGQSELDLGTSVKVSLAQFHGIEVNDFAVAVAKTALWIAEAQMRGETSEILHRAPDYLPLRDPGGIVEGNALRLDWPKADYVMGNPPFVGRQFRTPEQAADMDAVYADWKDTNYGKLDYVAAWYKKAADLMKRGEASRTAFVSTNSICQGESVAAMWKPLFERAGVVIDFAWRTFRWDNEAAEKAAVHCVIIGFHTSGNVRVERVERVEENKEDGRVEHKEHRGESVGSLHDLHVLHGQNKTEQQPKTIYDGEAQIAATNINGYLMDGPNVFLENRRDALDCDRPLVFGSMPNDGGFLSDYDTAARDAIVAKYPAAAPLFRRIVGSSEAINNVMRWCLWLKDTPPNVLRSIPPVMDALAKVREMRLKSKRASTRKLADTPHLFGEIRQPETNYLLIPSVSSERRVYVPMCFFDADVIANNLALIVPDASLYHFGVLTSSVHMAWMRVVAGRLKSDYRYSAAVVYNNFPWPTGDEKNVRVERVERVEENKEDGRVEHKEHREELLDSLHDLHVLHGQNKTEGKNDRDIITATAQSILSARALYPDSSLADLYDPLTMPPELRAAHVANDRAVLAAYGLSPAATEREIVAHLFRLYAERSGKVEG